MKANFLMIAVAATVLAACSNDENEGNNDPVEAKIIAGVGAPVSRAIDQNWSTGNTIGVRAIAVSATTEGVTSLMEGMYKNVKYTVSSAGSTGTFTAETGKGIFFQDASETVAFAAYSPYQTSTNSATLPGTEGEISGISTSSQTTQAAQEAFDFLYASSALASKSRPTVEFVNAEQFQHKMAKLVIVVKTSADHGFSAGDVTNGTYTLGGLKHSGTFNVTTGMATATGSTTNGWSLTTNCYKLPNETDKCSFSMILYPQDCSAAALSFGATISGQPFINTTSINPNLEAGKIYTYTITAKKTGLVVSGCTIGNWNLGTTGTGDAEMPN